jgi:phosphoglucosamine mutase
MNRLFGTDGIRAVAGEFPLDSASVRALGKALVALLKEKGHEPRLLIGRDTRESGQWIENALYQGCRREGGTVLSVGEIPTSAVSYLTKTFHFAAGVVISASHNPYLDNGIKIFSASGLKIPEPWERRLEKAVWDAEDIPESDLPNVEPATELLDHYREFLMSRVPTRSFSKKFKVVLDCANGAGSAIAPAVLRELGHEVIAVHNAPDGKNINLNCGSLHPQALVREVLLRRADIGIAYDGDADRAVWVDERGQVLNGDHTLYVQALRMNEKKKLKKNTVVATTMSNLGLEKALEREGIRIVRTQVGDKYVLQEMMKTGMNLGGEQSGHTIFLDDCPTGDGILTSLRMLEALSEKDATLSEMVSGLEEFPQVHLNVKVKSKTAFSEFPEITEAADKIREMLADSGRLELRYSGTEPLARIMIEGREKSRIERMALDLAEKIKKYLGRPE